MIVRYSSTPVVLYIYIRLLRSYRYRGFFISLIMSVIVSFLSFFVCLFAGAVAGLLDDAAGQRVRAVGGFGGDRHPREPK